MNNWIPHEKQNTYQRWQLATFDGKQSDGTTAPAPVGPPVTEANPQQPPPGPLLATQTPAVALPSSEDVERVYREAQEAGHAAGYAAGHGEGIAAAQAAAQAMAKLMDNLTQAMASIEQGVADQLLGLAIEIANQVLRQSLRLQPELILPVIREAVNALHPHHGQPQLFVHPDDAELVRNQLGEQLAHGNWRIIDDGTLTPGGCRIELGASQVDATLETRWRRVIEAIGVSQEWLQAQP
ncbi:MAG: flagellar assembly protein FliH [Candidatus Accumulibacter sp.]|uniref:flagellar assembly protein FliH n=1 Tax=Accumulibacter sp. TaxID=2053492 RepID=UPI001A37FF4D|nr:flagellar assembly protein FliH [Accumulibacter sp.]MBL8393732.1 flagellar assembly protein FliH [Accumulibacter sp.]